MECEDEKKCQEYDLNEVHLCLLECWFDFDNNININNNNINDNIIMVRTVIIKTKRGK